MDKSCPDSSSVVEHNVVSEALRLAWTCRFIVPLTFRDTPKRIVSCVGGVIVRTCVHQKRLCSGCIVVRLYVVYGPCVWLCEFYSSLHTAAGSMGNAEPQRENP